MEEYKLGALKNTKDNRDIQLAQVQAPVALPEEYLTDISMLPIFNQKMHGSCVGHAHALIHIYNEWKENKKIINASPRYLYAMSKKIDGNPNQGTYPRICGNVQVNKGCDTEQFTPCNDDLPYEEYLKVSESPEAKNYKMKGYAFVPNNLEALKQAIYQNGLVGITISVGNYDNPIKKGSIGLHRVVAYGYSKDKIMIINSWGKEWATNGTGYVNWNEQEITDIMTFVDMPNEVILEAKKKYKYFSDAEVAKWKLKPEFWQILDKARELAGVPFTITSGLRSSESNKAVGGVENSTHLTGLGCDIRCADGKARFAIIKGAIDAGIKRIGVYKSHIHLDIGKSPEYVEGFMWVTDKD